MLVIPKMDLYVETLTGAAFELRVSQFETVISVKAKIQRQEGIPISQQHLIWQSMELEDDNCLHDYSISDGATLKLVLAMRGGPINTRRVPVEDPALREMAEYMEANRDELLDKIPGNRQVTLLVYKEGDQLNFFRVVDRGDGTLTPLSESLSGTSVYNLYDEEDDSEGSAGLRDKGEENDNTKEKMKLLRMKMEDMSLSRKPKKPKPLPPSSGRPGSRSRRFHHYSYPASKAAGRISLSSKNILPPVGQTLQGIEAPCSRLELKPASGSTIGHLLSKDHVGMPAGMVSHSKVSSSLPMRDQKRSTPHGSAPVSSVSKGLSRSSGSNPMSATIASTIDPLDSSSIPSSSVDVPTNLPNSSNSVPGLTRLLSRDSAQNGIKEFPLEFIPRPPSSAKPPGTVERQKGLILESLSQQEARGLLRQASIERFGSSSISNFVPSAGKAQVSSFALQDQSHVPTEGRLLSARLRMPNSREGRTSPSTKLPPVKQKKKSKRCFLCTKKTGLANSYVCRCGNNFCSTHRYAEVHNCPFDYKTEGRKLLEQSNPVVNAPKLPKI